MTVHFLRTLPVLLALALASGGCGDDEELIDGTFSEAEWAVISTLSPLPAVPAADPTNSVADDAAAATLGQQLFFETSAAGPIVTASDGSNGGLGTVGETGKVACATCHQPGTWFHDERSNPNETSLAADWGGRNTPTAVNAAYYEWFKWGGGSDSLWQQALGTTESGKSHNSSRLAIAHMIDTKYKAEYEAVFGTLDASISSLPATGKPGDVAYDSLTDPQKTMVSTVLANYAKAIAAYERKLVSLNAPFDQYVAGSFEAISTAAKNGLKLFIGKAGCIGCHTTPLLSDSKFHNLGIAQEGTHVATSDLGRFTSVAKLLGSAFNSDGAYSDDTTTGKLAGLAQADGQKGQFRTKHLRQIAMTAPYMHTGQFATLRAMVEFYNDGGGTTGFEGTKSELMVPLNLSSQEMDDLVAFLETLTGDPIPAALQADTSK